MKGLIYIACFLSLSVFAKTYDIHPDRSRVEFEIMKYKIGSAIQGKFDRFKGSVHIKKGKVTDVRADIQVASINTDNEKRDKHLRSPDFFDVEKPSNRIMSFRQTEEATMAADFQVKGNLTLKGTTKKVVLDVKKVSLKRFKASVKINKKDFGVTWNAPLEKNLWKKIKGIVGKTVIGEEVEVLLDIILR